MAIRDISNFIHLYKYRLSMILKTVYKLGVNNCSHGAYFPMEKKNRVNVVSGLGPDNEEGKGKRAENKGGWHRGAFSSRAALGGISEEEI